MVRRTGPEGLLRAIFPRMPLEAPTFHYIVEGETEVSIIGALSEALETLPLTKAKGDPVMRPRMATVLRGLYGIEARLRTTAELAKQLRAGSPTVLSWEKRGLHYLSQPSTARRLRRFFAPTPAEAGALEERALRLESQLIKTMQENRNLQGQVEQYQENERRLRQALRRAGFPEPELNDIAVVERIAEERFVLHSAFDLMRARMPQDPGLARLQRALLRGNVHGVGELARVLESGELRRFRNVGAKGVELARELLRIAQEEVLPQEQPDS